MPSAPILPTRAEASDKARTDLPSRKANWRDWHKRPYPRQGLLGARPRHRDKRPRPLERSGHHFGELRSEGGWPDVVAAVESDSR